MEYYVAPQTTDCEMCTYKHGKILEDDAEYKKEMNQIYSTITYIQFKMAP